MQYVLIYILFEEVDQFKSIIKLMLDISKDFLPKTQSKSQSNLVIATLNYCDIMNNPFQFYCAQFQKELEQLSQIFVNLIPTYFPSFNIEQFKWSMGKLDQKIRIGRYSPAFDGQVGIIDNRFISKEQFEQKWDTQFTKILSAKQVPFTQQQRFETRAYDFLIYHTLLVFVYGIRPFSELIVNNSQAYRQKYKPFYQLSFLSQQRKLNKTMTSFSNIAADLFFIQQYSQKFKDEIQKTGKYYTISDQTKDTLIIAKKQAFKVNYPPLCILSKLELSKLNWAGRTAIAVLDRYIIINAHLSSDKAKNRIQINEVKMGLLQIQRKHPHHYIIVGGDLNSFLTTDQIFGATFNTFPSEECQVTTVKKRTMIQAQFHKGNKLVAESKDKIISNLPLEKGSLRYINNEQTNNDTLIPSDSHPFDHYVVVVQLKKP